MYHFFLKMESFQPIRFDETLGSNLTTVQHLQEKFEIIGARAQNGKTNIVIQMIENELEKNPSSLHIVCTQNTSSNQQQFYHRIPKDKVFSVGSFKDNDMRNLRRIAHMTVPIVTLCCNTTQLKAIHDTCMLLQEKENKHYNSIFLYIDEIHLYIKMAKECIENICVLSIVQKIIGLTATPLEVICLEEQDPHWSNLKCTDLTWLESNYFESNYFSLSSHEYTFVELKSVQEKMKQEKVKENLTISYASYVMDLFPDEFFQENKFTFVPSDVQVKYHHQMKDLIFRKCENSIVLMLNGNSKSIFTDRFTEIKLQETKNVAGTTQKQPSELIADILLRENLIGRPLFITGHNCIQIGISLASETTGSFTGSIISCSTMHKNADALYQIVARTTGNMMAWQTFRKTRIYCPEIVKEIVLERERNIFNIFQMSCLEKDTMLSRENYFQENKINASKKWSKQLDHTITEFNTQQEAMAYIKKKYNMKPRLCDEYTTNKSYLMPDPENPSGEKVLPCNEYILKYFSLKKTEKARKIQNNSHKWIVLERINK